MPQTDAPGIGPMARALGYAGLLPQVLVVATLLAGGSDTRFMALSLGYAYAAIIFSFLGGLWWGLASAARRPCPRWVWGVAVTPSLLSLLSAWPWATGMPWPGPSLVMLGIALAASLLVDLKLKRAGLTPQGWLALRAPLSIGLGVLTLMAGLI